LSRTYSQHLSRTIPGHYTKGLCCQFGAELFGVMQDFILCLVECDCTNLGGDDHALRNCAIREAVQRQTTQLMSSGIR
jgi:hypothetical protein